MRLAVLDVGSNSAQLQVTEASAGAPPLPLYAMKEPTRLGEELGHDGVLGEQAVARVVEAVARTLQAAHKWQVGEQLYPFVTAAIRDERTGIKCCDRFKTRLVSVCSS